MPDFTETEPPDTVVVTKYSPDGRTKIEYVYKKQNETAAGAAAGEPPMRKAPKSSIFDGVTSNAAPQIRSFAHSVDFRRRKKIILIKFILAAGLPVFLIWRWPSLIPFGLPAVLFICAGAAAFAVLPFSSLTAHFSQNSNETAGPAPRKRRRFFF